MPGDTGGTVVIIPIHLRESFFKYLPRCDSIHFNRRFDILESDIQTMTDETAISIEDNLWHTQRVGSKIYADYFHDLHTKIRWIHRSMEESDLVSAKGAGKALEDTIIQYATHQLRLRVCQLAADRLKS